MPVYLGPSIVGGLTAERQVGLVGPWRQSAEPPSCCLNDGDGGLRGAASLRKKPQKLCAQLPKRLGAFRRDPRAARVHFMESYEERVCSVQAP